MDSVNNEERLTIYKDLLRIPSISTKHESIEEAAIYLENLLKSNGIQARLMDTAGHPVVYGNYSINAPRTLLIYNHYDVQPVDPLDEWSDDPFSAKTKAGRIYARGASDNKGTLIARLFGIVDSIKNGELKVNLRFLYEGEEEIGSPNLGSFVKQHEDIFRADAVIMEGSQIGDRGRPVVSLGVKGLIYAELSTQTGSSDLHSSLAAIAPNPAWDLISALNDIYDGASVRIPGFYDDIRKANSKEEALLTEYPFNVEEMLETYGLTRFRYNSPSKLVNELFTSPTCNIDGIISGYTGLGSKTVTPRTASAKIDFRLVPNQDPHKIFESMRRYLKERGHSVQINEDGLEYPVRTDPESNIGRAMIESAKKVYGKKPVVMINSAGTQPMALFTRELNIREAVSAIGVGDNMSRAHAPNESVSIDNFYLAIDHTREFLRIFT